MLELGSFIAAPFAARLFGDFGAEVIKIERPNGGDELRDWRKTRGQTSMLFRTMGRNKKSVTLDLRSPSGQRGSPEDRRQLRCGDRELPARHAREVGPGTGRAHRRTPTS